MMVFVNNIPEATGVDQLRNAFSPMGKVFYAFIPVSSRRGKGVCFGFVRFGEMGTPIKAVDRMDVKLFADRKLKVNVARFGWCKRVRTKEGDEWGVC